LERRHVNGDNHYVGGVSFSRYLCCENWNR
jgi:hypothetical protein